MSQPTLKTMPLQYSAPQAPAPAEHSSLLRAVLWLALPVMAEQILHMMVGFTDTYLANHVKIAAAGASPAVIDAIKRECAASAAAVGTIQYFLWFIGLVVGSIGAGSTAIIARAKGARNRKLANSVCGQSVTASMLVGIALGIILFLGARGVVGMTALSAPADTFAFSYLRMLAWSLPFSMVMFIANSCLRGAGDAVTPAITMIIVDIVNMVFSFGLTYGWFGLPEMGFNGIAAGTIIAYIAGGVIQFCVLLAGRGGIRLHLHRLRPHWNTMRRVLRLGAPAAMEGMMAWLANFAVVIVINRIDPSNVMAAAHINAIRIESLSFLLGYAFAAAAATMVGQSLGMKDVHRATRSAYLCYAIGGSIMGTFGILFIFLGVWPARFLSENPQIVELTRQCLFITGFVQIGFAGQMIFGGALRGAGDTFAVMICNLISILGVRFTGVMFVGLVLHKGLAAIWIVLAGELFVRGALIYGRFVHGGWKKVVV